MKHLFWIFAAGLAVCTVRAQSASASFEIATIKPHDPSSPVAGGSSFQPRRFTAIGTLRSFVQLAYGVQDFEVSGGPSWTESERYELDARTASPTQGDALLVMLQNLLAERFQLKLHRESKAGAIYNLVIAKNGPRLQEEADKSRIGALSTGRGMLRGSLRLTDFARVLSATAGRPVIDRTGLDGAFKIDLRWSADDSSDAPPGPSLFTAIQEQLGLKLESVKGPVEILVIDRVEKPSPN